MELQHTRRSLTTTSIPLVYSVENIQVCFKNQVYDRAMDAKYIADHLGGSYHRLFDGGHDVIGAWKLTGSVSENKLEHLLGWTKGLWNDVITPRNLPYVTISQETYNKLHELTNIPKRELYKYLTWSPCEAVGIGLSVPSVATRTTTKNIYCHASIGTMLSVLSVHTRSIPAGLLATIQVVKILRVTKRDTESRKEAISGLLTALVVIGASTINPILGIAVAVSIQLLRTSKVIKRVKRCTKNYLSSKLDRLYARWDYFERNII